MGTHSAMVVRFTDGHIQRWERTFDGDCLVDQFEKWGMTNFAEPPDALKIGYGIVEIGNQGEGDQDYSLILDFKNKRFVFSWGITEETLATTNKLIANGWKIGVDGTLQEVMNDPSSLKEGSIIRDPRDW